MMINMQLKLVVRIRSSVGLVLSRTSQCAPSPQKPYLCFEGERTGVGRSHYKPQMPHWNTLLPDRDGRGRMHERTQRRPAEGLTTARPWDRPRSTAHTRGVPAPWGFCYLPRPGLTAGGHAHDKRKVKTTLTCGITSVCECFECL